MMKKIILLPLLVSVCVPLCADIQIPLNDINILNKTDDQIFFIAWRGMGLKSDYERILPRESTTSSSAGRSELQVELGPKVANVSSYRKRVNDLQLFKVTGSRITIELDKDGDPKVTQEGTLSGNLKTVEIKNKSDHVLFIAWARKIDVDLGITKVDLGKYKSNYSRFVPSKGSKTFHTAFNVGDSIQIEVGPKADNNYDKAAKKYNTKITKKRVDLNVNDKGYPVITQE